MTDLGKFQRCIHGLQFNRRPGFELFIVMEAVAHNHHYVLLHPYESDCTTMDEVTKSYGPL